MRYLSSLIILLTLEIFGCGGLNSNVITPEKPVLTGSTSYVDSNGHTFNAGGTVLVPPGSYLQPLPPMLLRLQNQSSQVSPDRFQLYFNLINTQITSDFNQRWLTSVTLVNYSGPFDPSQPTVVLRDGTDDTTPGAAPLDESRNVWVVTYVPHTYSNICSYLSHATINRSRPDTLPGQAVEAYGYTVGDYGHGPNEVADFDFPEHHGFSRVCYDYQGKPAYDLIHVLKYPGD